MEEHIWVRAAPKEFKEDETDRWVEMGSKGLSAKFADAKERWRRGLKRQENTLGSDGFII